MYQKREHLCRVIYEVCCFVFGCGCPRLMIECTVIFRNAGFCLNDRKTVLSWVLSGSCPRLLGRAPDFSCELVEVTFRKALAIVFWTGCARLSSRRRRVCAWLYWRYQGVADVRRSHALGYQVTKSLLRKPLQFIRLM